MQGLTLAAIIASEKSTFNGTLDLNNARLHVKSQQSHPSMKSRSRALGHSDCLRSISRTITMQGLTLAAISVLEKST